MSLRDSEVSRSRLAKRPLAKPTESKQQRERRLKQCRAKKQELRQRLVEDDDAVLTFKEWCALNGLLAAQWRLLKPPSGATVMSMRPAAEERRRMVRVNARCGLKSDIAPCPKTYTTAVIRSPHRRGRGSIAAR